MGRGADQQHAVTDLDLVVGPGIDDAGALAVDAAPAMPMAA
jgi:hypothetical protein